MTGSTAQPRAPLCSRAARGAAVTSRLCARGRDSPSRVVRSLSCAVFTIVLLLLYQNIPASDQCRWRSVKITLSGVRQDYLRTIYCGRGGVHSHGRRRAQVAFQFQSDYDCANLFCGKQNRGWRAEGRCVRRNRDTWLLSIGCGRSPRGAVVNNSARCPPYSPRHCIACAFAAQPGWGSVSTQVYGHHAALISFTIYQPLLLLSVTHS